MPLPLRGLLLISRAPQRPLTITELLVGVTRDDEQLPTI